jgi:predicted nucleic acid-binding protein
VAVIVDTTVLVDYLRGRPQAIGTLAPLVVQGHVYCSRVTRIELALGMRAHQLEQASSLYTWLDTIEADAEIGAQAEVLAGTWGRSHSSIDVADYLIAATAQVRGLELVTTNVRHFPMIDGLVAPY